MDFVLKLTGLLIAGVLGFVALAALGVAGLFGLANPFGTEEIDRSQPPILKSIEDIDEYHAAVGNFEVILDVEEDVNYVPSIIAGERSLFVAAGTVDAVRRLLRPRGGRRRAVRGRHDGGDPAAGG